MKLEDVLSHLCNNCRLIIDKRNRLVKHRIPRGFEIFDVYRTEEHVSKIPNDKLDAEITAAQIVATEKEQREWEEWLDKICKEEFDIKGKTIVIVSNNFAHWFTCDICGCNHEAARVPKCLASPDGLGRNRYVCETCGSKYAPKLLQKIIKAEKQYLAKAKK